MAYCGRTSRQLWGKNYSKTSRRYREKPFLLNFARDDLKFVSSPLAHT